MRRYVLRRSVALLVVFVLVSFTTFVIAHFLPGDPAQLILGQDATPERIRELRHELGLDKTFLVQYADFAAGLVHGDLGRSYQTRRLVSRELMQAFPVTLELSIASMVLSILVGVSAGVWAAVRAHTILDDSLRGAILTLTSIPTFWLGLLLIYGFSVELGWFPSFGWGTWKHLVLPAITLATFPLALIARLTRATVADELGAQYVTTARSKGLLEQRVILHHALRNAMLPIVTVIGLQFATLLAGAILTESVFSIPGMGKLLVDSVFSRDYAIIRGSVLLAAILFAITNFFVDLSYAIFDPRLRYE